VYTELMCYSHYYEIIGQADKTKFWNDRTFGVRDYKTSETIDMVAEKYYRKNLGYKIVPRYMAPISHLPLLNFWDYALQLSGYAYLLELYGWKLRHSNGVPHLYIEHVQFKDRKTGEVDKVVDIPVPYLKAEVHAMFEYNRAQRRLNRA